MAEIDDTEAATSTASKDGIDQQQKTTTAQKPETKTLTQAEIDAIVEDRLKRDREAREKELGMSTKEAKALIKARKEAEEAEKTALEKANEKAAELEKALNERNLRDLKRTLVDGMIASKQIKLPDGVSISDVLDMVNGADEDGIVKSVEKLTKFFPFNASMGSGSNPANGGQKEPSLDEQIKEAQIVGFSTGDWTKFNRLTMQKMKG
jgi:ribosome-binding protein aMBF1 (putative translation factor)